MQYVTGKRQKLIYAMHLPWANLSIPYLVVFWAKHKLMQ